jgi:hypothetical protein
VKWKRYENINLPYNGLQKLTWYHKQLDATTSQTRPQICAPVLHSPSYHRDPIVRGPYSRSVSKKIVQVVWNPNFNSKLRFQDPATAPILSQETSVHTITSCLFNIHVNVIISPKLVSPKRPHPFVLPY